MHQGGNQYLCGGPRIAVAILLPAVGLASVASAKEVRTAAKGQSAVTVKLHPDSKEGDTTVHTVNRSFDVLPRPAPAGALLLDQQVETEGTFSGGYSLAKVTLKASTLSGTGSKAAFTIQERGSLTSRSPDDALFVVTDVGCCGSTDTHTVYSLENGKRLFYTSGQGSPSLLLLEVGGSERYYVGVHVAGSSRDQEVYGGLLGKGEAGILVTLSSPREPKDVLLLTFDPPQPKSLRTSDVRWAPPGNMSFGGRLIRVPSDQTTTIEIEIGMPSPIRIPVVSGSFRLESVTTPPGLHVRRASPK